MITNLSLHYFKNQIKFKNSLKILLNYVKFKLLTAFFRFSDFA